MTKIDIISGFLGAGKTTLIKKLLKEALNGQKVVLIENEFGEIGIDGGFMKEAGIEVTEMNSGCICCSLVGDFGTALKEVLTKYSPDRIIIEPSGVGKLSDVISAVKKVSEEVAGVSLNAFVTVVDAGKCKMYMKNFGEFYNNQIENAGGVILSRSQNVKEKVLLECVSSIKKHNPSAAIITTPWDELTGNQILEGMENKDLLKEALLKEEEICPSCGHAHHEDNHDHHHEGCGCGHHHDESHHTHEDGCHNHHHGHEIHHGHDGHHHHEDCDHNHQHDHDNHHSHEGCCHNHHDHNNHHHNHHHADDVFTSWGSETVRKYGLEELKEILSKLEDSVTYGTVLRAKGILMNDNGGWIHFDYVPGEMQIREGGADYTGRLCVIGADLAEEKLSELFTLE